MISVLTKNKFVQQVSLLASGTGLSQIISLVSLPLITRLYSPEDFGVFAVMMAIVALGAVLVSFRYENAIIAVDSVEEAKIGVYSIFWISLFVSSMGLMSLFFASYLGVLELTHLYVGLISVLLMLVSAWGQALYYYNNKVSNYGRMTRGRIYSALALAISTIYWGVIYNSHWGLLLGSLVGALVNLLYLLYASYGIQMSDWMAQRTKVTSFARAHIRFPKYLVASSLIDRAGSQGHLLVFAKVFGETVAGALSLYSKTAGLPVTLIGNAIGDVFKRNASEQLQRNGECKSLVKRTAATLFSIAFLPFLALAIWGPFLFVLVFGSEWSMAGEFAQILSPVFLFGFVISPISSLIYLEDNQKYDLMLQVLLLLLLVVSFAVAVHYQSVYLAVIGYAFSYLAKYIAEGMVCYRIATGGNGGRLK